MTTERELTVRPGAELGPDVSDAPASDSPPTGWPATSGTIVNPCYRIALLFAEHYGLLVHPLNGKKPLLKVWQKRTAPPSAEEIRQWWATWPDANLGIVTGKAGNLAVIDVDSRDAERWLCDLVLTTVSRDAALSALDREWFPDDDAFQAAVRAYVIEAALGTLRVNTSIENGFQKYQLYFQYPTEGGFKTTSNPNGVYPGIDTRGDGGQIAAPPSIHPGNPDKGIPAGAVYTVVNPGAPILPVPGGFLAALRSIKKQKTAAPLPDVLPEGDRETALMSLFGRMWAMNASVDAIRAAMLAENVAKCDPPLSEERIDEMIASGQRNFTARSDFQSEYPLGSDAEMGARIADAVRDRIRILLDRGSQVIVFTGKCWEDDPEGNHHSREIVKQQLATWLGVAVARAKRAATDKERESAEWAIKLISPRLNEKKLSPLLKHTRDAPVLHDQWASFDSNPWLLVVENGTLDLRAPVTFHPGVFRAEDRVYRRLHVAYDPAAECPTWDRVITTLAKGKDGSERPKLGAFIWRMIGYSLLGFNPGKVAVFLVGVGDAGKSRFLAALLDLFGPLGVDVKINSLCLPPKWKREAGDAAIRRPDLIRVLGTRIAACSEAPKDTPFDVELLKAWTGGDAIPLRDNHQKGATIARRSLASATPWLAYNEDDSPIPPHEDTAFWSRIYPVPISYSIPKADQDELIGEKLRAELPGALARAVEEFRSWHTEGLVVPAAVLATREKYRTAFDSVAQFIADKCVRAENAQASGPDLVVAYRRWAQNEPGAEDLGRRALFARLEKLGFTKRESKGHPVRFEGLQLIGPELYG